MTSGHDCFAAHLKKISVNCTICNEAFIMDGEHLNPCEKHSVDKKKKSIVQSYREARRLWTKLHSLLLHDQYYVLDNDMDKLM
jgi:hypothetical protein